MERKIPPEYLDRNLDVANAYGLSAGLCKIRERMALRRDCPVWLLRKLSDMIVQSGLLVQPLIDYRDEVSPYEDGGINDRNNRQNM